MKFDSKKKNGNGDDDSDENEGLGNTEVQKHTDGDRRDGKETDDDDE